MSDQQESDDQLVGHSSTTAPGGEKNLDSGDPGRTPGKAEGGEEEAEESLGRQGD